MKLSSMYFIEIVTLGQAEGFTKWMRDKGKALSFNDSEGFKDWLNRYTAFPLQLYMNGSTYEFKDRQQADFFMIGFEAAMDLRMNK